MESLVYIIILTHNGRKWINNCLRTVLKTDYSNFRILVADNASKDGSADYIKEKFPQVKLIKNRKNYGFAEGNNIGMRYALKQGADYIILLNQDTKVEPNWISELVKVAEDDKQIGILSPMQYDYKGEGIDRNFFDLLNTSEEFKTDFLKNFLSRLYSVERVIGSAMFMSKELCKKVGLFDPLYFCYHEETDLCRRALYYKFKVNILTTSKIYHWHTLLHKDRISERNKYLFLRNKHLYFLKNPGREFARNVYDDFKWGAKNIAQNERLFENFKSFLRFMCIQVWILYNLPRITYRHYLETK